MCSIDYHVAGELLELALGSKQLPKHETLSQLRGAEESRSITKRSLKWKVAKIPMVVEKP